MKISKRWIGIGIITVLLLGICIWVGPVDHFSHGYYCDEINYYAVQNDILQYVTMEPDKAYAMSFAPQKKHFAGFELNLANQPEGNAGILELKVLNDKDKVLDTIEVDLGKVQEHVWYKTYTNVRLKKGKTYTVHITARNCTTYPQLMMIDPDYIRENITGNLFMGYAYADSTFTFQNKVLIILFLLSVWLLCMSRIVSKENLRVKISWTASIIFLATVLAWNYMYNSMDIENDIFPGFQMESEILTRSVIEAEHNGSWFNAHDSGPDWSDEYVHYGLGRYVSNVQEYTDDSTWLNGYSRNESAIIVSSSDYARMYAIPGNYIKFVNGDAFPITDVSDDGTNIIISLSSGRLLNSYKFGRLKEAVYCTDDQVELAPLNNGVMLPYKSQYGLQGKMFRHLARFMKYDGVYENLYLLCSLAAGLIFAVIVMLIDRKYNRLMAVVFYCTFWLSPWVVSFARNLYWVEFTWFVPMAIGLFCAWRINSKANRILCYVLSFMAIMVKSLCGYEYISVIMMGLIAFLLTDCVVTVSKKETEKAKLLFRTIVIMGIAALMGFMAAICIHAPLKGDGNVLTGIKNIIAEDVLRRTGGADLNEFASDYWPSFNASVWETLCKYFHFNTEIITGIRGNLFPVLCLTPLCIFGYEWKKKQLNIELLSMYVISFLTSVSWFCLAKSHSYIHVHINFVLWYFGFVQICIYVILNKLIMWIRENKKQ